MNHPPHATSEALPEDGQEHLALDTHLTWTGSDPDVGDTLVYDVYLGTTDEPQLVITGQAETVYDTSGLKVNTTYYWKIIARDNHGTVTQGPVWHFTTIMPGQVQFTAEAFSAIENEGSASIALTRTDGSDSEVSVTLATSDGSAQSGIDYTFVSKTILFAHGETSKTIDIPILDDGRLEGDETINLTLGDPKGGAVTGQPVTAVLTIQDDGGDIMAGDVDGSGYVDLLDLRMTLQIMSGETPQSDLYKDADINGDGKIGREEAIYILQKSGEE
jgi:hypothetical protein